MKRKTHRVAPLDTGQEEWDSIFEKPVEEEAGIVESMDEGVRKAYGRVSRLVEEKKQGQGKENSSVLVAVMGKSGHGKSEFSIRFRKTNKEEENYALGMTENPDTQPSSDLDVLLVHCMDSSEVTSKIKNNMGREPDLKLLVTVTDRDVMRNRIAKRIETPPEEVSEELVNSYLSRDEFREVEPDLIIKNNE